MIATGWLIAPNLVVTAGHCSFDWNYKFGQVVQAVAYIGYQGHASVNAPGSHTQRREGVMIATTKEWIVANGSRAHDVSFIELNAPFDDVVPYKFDNTPVQGRFNLGVVGYPGDLTDAGEAGAHMYEMWLETDYKLTTSQWRMLEYEIDTYSGTSSPKALTSA
jgi:V8-like Glu-specific endopeptidase